MRKNLLILYTLMKSYSEWQSNMNGIQQAIEWSVQSLWRRGMSSPEEKQEMERIGAMLGQKSWLNPFAPDLKQQGDDFMTLINRISSGQSNPAEIYSAAAPNSPFMQAYKIIKKLKKELQGQDLSGEDVKNLLSVLRTAHKDGRMDSRALKALWSSVTGLLNTLQPNAQRANKINKDAALQYEVYTPFQLLRQLTSVGNGLFRFPANEEDVRIDSSNVMKQVYPQLYRARFKREFGYEPPDMPRRKGLANSQSAPPDNVEINGLGDAINKLKQVKDFPTSPEHATEMKRAIQEALPELEKLLAVLKPQSPLAPTVAAPTSPAAPTNPAP